MIRNEVQEIPDYVHAQVKEKLDSVFIELPEFVSDRPAFRRFLLDYFNRHETLPDLGAWIVANVAALREKRRT